MYLWKWQAYIWELHRCSFQNIFLKMYSSKWKAYIWELHRGSFQNVIIKMCFSKCISQNDKHIYENCTEVALTWDTPVSNVNWQVNAFNPTGPWNCFHKRVWCFDVVFKKSDVSKSAVSTIQLIFYDAALKFILDCKILWGQHFWWSALTNAKKCKKMQHTRATFLMIHLNKKKNMFFFPLFHYDSNTCRSLIADSPTVRMGLRALLPRRILHIVKSHWL